MSQGMLVCSHFLFQLFTLHWLPLPIVLHLKLSFLFSFITSLAYILCVINSFPLCFKLFIHHGTCLFIDVVFVASIVSQFYLQLQYLKIDVYLTFSGNFCKNTVSYSIQCRVLFDFLAAQALQCLS